MTIPKSDYKAPSIESNLERNGLPVEKVVIKKEEGNSTPPNSQEGQEQIDWKAKFEEAEAKLKAIPVIEKILTPEEIEAKLKEEENELISYVVTDKKLSALDYEKFKTVQTLPAKDFVFERYKAEAKKENADLSDAEILFDFEAEYGFASANEKVQERAQRRVELEAKTIQSEEFKPFFGLKEELATVKSIKAKADVYNKFVSSSNPVVAVSTKIEGLKEPVSVEVDYSDIASDIKKELATKELFAAFTAEGVDTEKAINSYIETEIQIRKRDLIVAQLVDKAYVEKMKQIKLGSVAAPEVQTGTVAKDIPNPAYDFITKAAANLPK